MGDYDN